MNRFWENNRSVALCPSATGFRTRGSVSTPGLCRALGSTLLVFAAVIFVLAVAPNPGVAANSVSAGTESIFSFGAGSRALGMGGAFTAVCDDATASYWNPAGLSCLEQTVVTGFHSTLFEGSSLDFFSIGHPTIRFGGLGFAFFRVGTDGIQTYDDRSRSLGQIDFSQTEMIFSYGRKIPFDVHVGASLKVVSQRMGDLSAGGAGFDVGVFYPVRYVRGLSLGLALRDLPGAKLKLAERVERTPRTIRAGASYTDSLRNGRDVVLVAVDASLPEKANTNVSVGGEYLIDRLVALRAGFKEGKLSAGVGVRWRNYAVDYSLGNSDLGNLHQFSVSASFGDPVALRRQREERERKREVARMLEEERVKRVEAHAELARQAFDKASYSAALEEWNLVLEYDPENARAKENIKKVKETLAKRTEEEAKTADAHARLYVFIETGRKCMTRGDLGAALLQFKQADELDPGNSEAKKGLRQTDSLITLEVASNVALANNLTVSGKYMEAYSAWSRVLILRPENEEAKRGVEASKSAVETVGRDLAEARHKIDALTLYTNAVRAYDRGDYKEAKVQLQEMLKLYPADQEGLRLADKIEERLSPETPRVGEDIKKLYVEGMNHFNSGEYEKAIESWKKILTVDPQNEMVARNIEKAKARLSSGERKAQ